MSDPPRESSRPVPRRRAREAALAALFAEEFGDLGDETWPETLSALLSDEPLDGYALSLVQGVTSRKEELDETIGARSHHWRIERMSLIDRNILRLGAYEILFVDDVPDIVAINEAVELARTYGDTESFSFVNGVLDSLARSAPEEPR